jgi:redox-sensitive bicupin YhaK (pirin superfamily)
MIMKARSIKQIIPARMYNMGEIKVRQPLPSPELEYLDPFVLLHHADLTFDENLDLNKAGVGPHPHKGFAPVTFLFKGGSHHRDSRGNNAKVLEGGTQWMHAGMGIVHSERPVGNEQELIQMWINSPAKNKNDQPYYHPLTKEQTPSYTSDDKKITINIITGELFGIKGPIPTLSPINSATVYSKAGGKLFISLPKSHNTFLYLLDGVLKVGGKEITGKNFIAFNNDADGMEIEAVEDTRCLLMSGEPIGEEIVAQGPFVMNTETEIMKAYSDYRMGKMGILIED